MLTPEELDKVCSGHCNLSDGFCLHHLIATEDKMFVQMVRVLDDFSNACYDSDLHLDRDEWIYLKSLATAVARERGIK